MKRIRKWLAALLALALCACGTAAPVTLPRRTPEEVSDAMEAAQGALPELTELAMGDREFDAYLERYYGIDPDTVEDGVIRLAEGVEAQEFAALLLRDAEAAREARKRLEEYLEDRAGEFAGYAPEQAAMAENGAALDLDRWAALAICPEPEDAEAAFRACFTADWTPPSPRPAEKPTPTPGETRTPEPAQSEAPDSDDYDHDAVLAAWRTGVTEGLSEKNRAILEAAEAVLAQRVKPEMSEYEKELAVHDWMIANGEYDPGELSHLTHRQAASDPDNDNPYGFLCHGKGVCLGYSSTFQLFMDLLGIECITVHGTAYEEEEEHAWNMVRLDGAWYCVDVTWDDPVVLGGGRVSVATAHSYFNVTSDDLRATAHHWDEMAVPEATATAWAWQG